jgi:deoxyribose-phosphate aldolase
VNFVLSHLYPFSHLHSRFLKPIQGYSRLLNPIQGVLRKIFFSQWPWLGGFKIASRTRGPRLQTLTGPKADRFKPIQGIFRKKDCLFFYGKDQNHTQAMKAPVLTSQRSHVLAARMSPAGRRFNVPTVDAVMAEERATSFTKRSIKTSAKLAGLKLAVSMMDLTTLEGKDTPGKVAYLCRKALQPAEPKYGVPSCAAVCVYPNMVKYACKFLGENSGVHVASVATGFPSGQFPLRTKLEEVRRAAGDGADEIDMVIDRGDFLAGHHAKMFDEIAATKEACGAAHLKVILETGELVTYDNVRLASEIAMQAGADFIKTSTGKVNPAATMPVTLVMLEAIRDYFFATGVRIGMKPAGGIRTAKQSLAYLVMVKETLGDDWLTPDLFRFGASTLVNDVLMQIAKTVDGNYQAADYFSMP